MLKKLLRWFQKLFGRERLYKYQFVDDVPDRMRSGTVYLVGKPGLLLANGDDMPLWLPADIVYEFDR